MNYKLLSGALLSSAVLLTACGGNTDTKTDTKSEDKTEKKAEKVTTEAKKGTSEQERALNKAKTYSNVMHMSKQGIYNQLTSDADKFSESDAKYAIDNLKANYKENAAKKAKDYAEQQNMSNDAVYNQLISQIDGFTESEAKYAVSKLK